MNQVKRLTDLIAAGQLAGKRVFIRADLNVPQDDQGNITEDTRIRASVPAIKAALDAGAAVMVTSHLGRPTEGEFKPEDSLAPVAKRLSELLGREVPLVANWVENGVNVTPGNVVLLENCRVNKGEKKNSDELAQKMAKLCDIYGLDGPFLDRELRKFDLQPADIDIVVNTHLHFDHCGGNTRIEKDKAVPAFPNARYFVHRAEYDHAMNPTERDRASYFPDNYVPVREAGQFDLLDGDQEIVPGVELVRLPGHVLDMFGVKLTGGGQTALLFGDLVPTTAHLPLPWIMGYDLYPMTTLENKKRWIPQVVREGWLALFAHDDRVRAAYVRERDGQWETEPVTIE